MPKVHQIWVGPAMPKNEQVWSAGIKEAATAAGWEYTLYGLFELMKALPEDAAINRLVEYCAVFPNKPKLAGVMCDYARVALVEKYFGLYLDTDFKFRGGVWPEFPTKSDLYVQGGVSAENTTTAILWYPPGAFSEKVKIWKDASAARILEYFPPLTMDANTARIKMLVDSIPFLPKFVGPQWLRKIIGPLTLLPRDLADWSFRTPGAKLVHYSQWRWNSDGIDV